MRARHSPTWRPVTRSSTWPACPRAISTPSRSPTCSSTSPGWPDEALRRTRRLLRPGGVVIASLPNLRHFWTLRDLVFRREFRYADAGVLDRTHLRFFTARTIPEWFGHGGMEIVRIQGINPIEDRRFVWLDRLLLGWLDDCRWLQYAIVARPAILSSA